MTRLAGIAALISTTLLASACATIFTGTRDTISFNTTPAGALVMIDGIDVGRTPVTARVKRGVSDRVVTLRMEGYADRTFVLGKELNLVSVLNLSNLAGWGIDAASGALFKYSQRAYDLELERRAALADQLDVEEVLLLSEVARDSAGVFRTPRSTDLAIVDPATRTVLVLRQFSPPARHTATWREP